MCIKEIHDIYVYVINTYTDKVIYKVGQFYYI